MAAYTIASHPVKDFVTWKSLFDQFEPIRKEGANEVPWSYGMQTTLTW